MFFSVCIWSFLENWMNDLCKAVRMKMRERGVLDLGLWCPWSRTFLSLGDAEGRAAAGHPWACWNFWALRRYPRESQVCHAMPQLGKRRWIEDPVMGDAGSVTVTLGGVRRALTTPFGRAVPEEHTQQGLGEVGGPGSCRGRACWLSRGKE